jgi:hypothetical protein
MTTTLGRLVAVLLTFALISSTLFAQEQSKPKEFIGEGVVVAFLKTNRYPVMGPVRGVANFVEYWIVRINKWEDAPEPLKSKVYFRVEYNIYERGLTDCEINGANLLLKLRARRENEHTDCYGSGRELSDYIRTTPGQKDSLPSLDSLPCLIADRPPIVIPE